MVPAAADGRPRHSPRAGTTWPRSSAPVSPHRSDRAIVHGDFRLGNLLVGRVPTVTAVIDWEIWTVGDPRVDLGWFLANADPGDLPAPDPRTRVTLPSARELLGRLRRRARPRRSNDVEWFRALACFKSTATWSLIVKHNRRRAEPDPEVEAMAAVLPAPPGTGTRPAHLTTVPVSAAGSPADRSATFASASAREPEQVFGGEQVGCGLVAPSAADGERHLVHLGGTVGEAEHERLDEVLHERHLVGDAERAVQSGARAQTRRAAPSASSP